MGRNMWRKLGLVVAISVMCAFATVYVAFFHHAPPQEILALNKAQGRHARKAVVGRTLAENLDDDEAAIAAYQVGKWDAWVEAHNYVSVGETYDKCEGADRLMLGRLIMVPLVKHSGLGLRLYVNATFQKDVTDGSIHINCLYNGRQLYHNVWDLCTAEDREIENVDRVITCPLLPGRFRVVKNMKIPSFLPKGRYEVSVKMINQDEETFLCTDVDFTLS